MKKLLILALGILGLSSFFYITPVFAQTPNLESIKLFEIDLTLDKSTDIRIHEKIHYYFPSPKHGIYRNIPINKRSEGNALKSSTVVEIKSLKYYPADNPVRTSGMYTDVGFGDQVSLKIGDPYMTVTGLYVYEIYYVVKNGINYFEDHDELYWNIIGTGWNVPIEKVQATINLPGKIEKTACYTGRYGARGTNCTLVENSETQLSLSTNTVLNSNEAVTLAVAMPKGTMDDMLKKEKAELLRINIIGLSSLLLLPLFYFLGLEKGGLKNPKLTVVPSFTPPKDINPLLAGYLLSKGKLASTTKVITAQIIYLAIKGYLKIEQKEKENYIIRPGGIGAAFNMEEPSSLLLYSALFSKSFEFKTEDPESSLSYYIFGIWKKAKEVLEELQYLSKKRERTGRWLRFLAVILFTTGIVVALVMSVVGSIVGGIAVFITGFIFVILTILIDSKTKEGNKLYYELLGLKMYINTAEKHRIEFHNDPEKYKGVFEDLLPYAIIFGLEKKWIKEFKDLYKVETEWYMGDLSTFNTSYMGSSIMGINSDSQSSFPTLVSNSSSTGGGWSSGSSGFGGGSSGGSSGGGGGGGGGGSW